MAGSLLLCTMLAYGIRPPGTIKAKQDGKMVYVDKEPISHMDWFAYLWHLQHVDSLSEAEILLLMPDTNFYRTVEEFSMIRFDERRDAPVVGLNDVQKTSFAQWRSCYVQQKKKYANFIYEVITADEYDELCSQNRKLKKIDNEPQVLRCVVKNYSGAASR